MATTVKSLLASATLGKPSIVELKPYLQPFPYVCSVSSFHIVSTVDPS